jgi:hypothetical protein
MSFWLGFILGVVVGELLLMIILLLCYVGSDKK